MVSTQASHLELACNHVLERWFPVNSSVLERIRAKLARNEFHGDVGNLINELKGDFGLLFYCIKELCEDSLVSAHTPVTNPFALLREAGLEGLQKILTKEGALSAHTFKNITQAQSRRIKEAMLSATVAESACEKAELDPEIGISSALLRQLGMTLIAWNYPHVFIRAITTLQTSKQASLDLALHKILGFSPTLLGAAIAQRWNFGAKLRYAAGDPSVAKDETLSSAEREGAEMLVKICKVGEALARASNPEQYPSALTDWKEAEEGIKRFIGPGGVAEIQARLKKNCRDYVMLNGDVSNFEISVEQETKIKSSAFARDLKRSNVYITKCPPLLQAQLNELYESLKPGEISRESLDTLVREVFPCAGFDAGCIFMLDPYSMVLTPMLKVSSALLPHLHSVKVNSPELSTNPIVTAFTCSTPIKGDELGKNGEMVSFIAASVGVKQKTGVLYLEISDRLKSQQQADPMLHFKAVRQCLNDCLGL